MVADPVAHLHPDADDGAVNGSTGAGGMPPSLEMVIADRIGRRARRRVGVVVGVSIADEEAVVGFGATHRGGSLPDERTSFQIGSVTKVFTALLLADAVDRGEVAFDQPLTSLFPEAASHPAGRPIQLADLASHTGGLPRLPPGFTRLARRSRHDPYALFMVEHLERALSVPPKRPPGGRPRYSSFGTGTLSEALARATATPYPRLVHDRIVEPLGLEDTRVEPDGSESQVAVGHTRRGRTRTDWHLPALAGAGALRSSVRDLLVFLGAHMDPESTPLEVAVRSVLEERARIGKPLAVGLGWHILDRKGGARWWWHNGGTGGFRSFVGFDPAAGRAVAVLANDTRSVDRIGQLILESPKIP